MKTDYFGAAFNAAVEKLHTDAAAAGISMSALCDAAEVSRTTPHRYTRELPHTVITMEKLQRKLDELRAGA